VSVDLRYLQKHRGSDASRSAESRYSPFVTTTPLAAVLGANCRRIRTNAEVTQDELARAARQVGLKWTASKVRDFESGRSGPTFATVLALTAALDSITNDQVALADLVSADGEVTITEDFEPTGDRLADYCAGGTWERGALTLGHAWDSAHDRFFSKIAEHRESVIDWRKTFGLTEERIASGLGISNEQLCDMSLELWNTTFSTHRDRLAGSNANQQRKGQVTRQLKAQLKAELEKVIADGDD
jgi:transcriptional regulator with XRE-family HTH domain